MTKIIGALLIIGVLFGGWNLFLYWEKVKNEEETQRKEEATSAIIPEQLPGLPPGLEPSLRAAEQQGAASMTAWLKTYGPSVQDPRKAWIELDYCRLLSRENPAEARRIFASVKERTPATSPVYPRIKQLEKTYE
ncbi:MAG TPA: hypothetical protein VN673_18125 [Clostridia bacterium]|nr:hypothetical protein [Clostridia bacterium]